MMKRDNFNIPLLLDTATYIAIATMSLLGISGLRSLKLQLVALGLCLLFGILYRFQFQTGRYQRSPNLYFGAQAITLALVYSLGSSSADAFNFLFLLLAIHTTLVLPGKQASLWIAIYYGVVSSIVLITRGTDGIYAIVFYLSVYAVCGFFGYALQQAEVARDKNQRLVEELQETQRKLQELAVLEERNRLARDLHDSVKQQVFAISMQLSAARTALSESDQAYASVSQAEKLAQQASAELTTLIHQLRPPGLERKSLASAIKEQVSEWTRQNNIKTELVIEDVSVDLHIEQALFRVLQEALANVARHSRADKASIALTTEKDCVILRIEDNGVGYDTETVTKGIGLDSMKERLSALNGTLAISSRRSQGTIITATVRSS